MTNGVKVVGGPAVEPPPDLEAEDLRPDPEAPAGAEPGPRRPAADPVGRRRRLAFGLVSVVAVLGLVGTVVFGLAWSNQRSAQASATAARQAAGRFLTALTNFDAKTVDADFSSITAMATGRFATQANQFFNSSIRQELENALATSRGQIRSLYVQSSAPDQASVYAVVDQVYANNKISTPQSDVLRIVVDLQQTGGNWKVDDVTVLEGPSALGTGGTSAAGG
jgi:hypothetical protein